MSLKYPVFLAHTSDVKEGFKKPLIQYQKRILLANADNQYSTISNICPHQGSLILSNPKKHLVCQYHAWSWDAAGNPKGSGTTHKCNSFKLDTSNTYVSNNLIFNKNISFPDLPINFQYLELVEERVDQTNATPKNIMDLFLDVDHIPVVHPKLYDDIGVTKTTSVEWKYFDWGSIQLVHKDDSYSEEYLSTLRNTPDEELAAIWIAVYPYTMIEWQPGAMFVTIANGANVTVLKYRDTRYSDKNWNLNSSIWEEAWRQDVQQSENIVSNNIPEAHYEESKQHFHTWMENNK